MIPYDLTGSAVYWGANFTYDFGCYCAVTLLCLVLAANTADISLFQDARHSAATCYLLVLYGLAVIPWTYLLSLRFSSAASAQAGRIACVSMRRSTLHTSAPKMAVSAYDPI